MADLFSIPTLLVCTGTVTLIVALVLTMAWFRGRAEPALGLWCVALWLGTLSSLLLALRTVAPFWLSIGLGNLGGAGAYALMWSGSRAFDGRSRRWAMAAAGPVVWMAAFCALPVIHGSVNGRIVLMSMVIGSYALATAWEIARGQHREPLPSRILATLLFASHGLVYLARIPLVAYAPPAYRRMSGYSDWYALITFELFVHTMFAAIMILALIKERAEARYRTASERDPLTGILNRRAFATQVERALARDGDVAMMLLDIDHFKVVNDQHGHLVGDRVLVAFADAVGQAVADEEIAGALFGRLGGEEFALFVPAACPEASMALAERLRERVAGLSLVHMGARIDMTVSIGVAHAIQTGRDFDALVGAADFVLYEAKGGGRNRAMAYDPVRHLLAIAERGRAAAAADGHIVTVPNAG